VTPDGDVERRRVGWVQTGDRSWRGQSGSGTMSVTLTNTGEFLVVGHKIDIRLKPVDDERAAELDRLMFAQPTIEAACSAARTCCETIFKAFVGSCDLETELHGGQSLRTCMHFIETVNEMEGIPAQCAGPPRVTPKSLAEAAPRQRTAKQEQQSTRARLKTFLADCRKNDFRAAAGAILYRGDDSRRKWKDTLRGDIETERALGEAVCTRVKNYLQGTEAKFVTYFETIEPQGRWLRWQMDFKGVPVLFSFLRLGDKLAIGEFIEVKKTQ
jgi:hypothetical protein